MRLLLQPSMHLRAVLALCALAALPALPATARAHPQAAQSPVFDAGECVTVVDKSTTRSLQLSYSLPFDDVEIGFADIPVTDAKTHQFFAFGAAVHPDELFFAAYPFDAARQPHRIPEWVRADDVRRAAQLASMTAGIAFDEAGVLADGLLESDPMLTGLWLPITAYDARVPITIVQAAKGAQWDVTSVPAGVYTVAGYVFSPPYNAWAVRPGLVKVVEAGRDLAALVVDPINEFLFPYQGRRVGLCSSVPAGTRLSGFYRVEDSSDHPWSAFITEREVTSGRSELCFRVPAAGVTGAIRLRFDLQTPDGTRSSFYSPDTLNALSSEGRCVASEVVCCEASGTAGGAAQPAAGSNAAVGGSGGVQSQAATSSGCAMTSTGARDASGGGALVIACLAVAVRRRRRIV